LLVASLVVILLREVWLSDRGMNVDFIDHLAMLVWSLGPHFSEAAVPCFALQVFEELKCILTSSAPSFDDEILAALVVSCHEVGHISVELSGVHVRHHTNLSPVAVSSESTLLLSSLLLIVV
jgi:hypothetical protein